MKTDTFETVKSQNSLKVLKVLQGAELREWKSSEADWGSGCGEMAYKACPRWPDATHVSCTIPSGTWLTLCHFAPSGKKTLATHTTLNHQQIVAHLALCDCYHHKTDTHKNVYLWLQRRLCTFHSGGRGKLTQDVAADDMSDNGVLYCLKEPPGGCQEMARALLAIAAGALTTVDGCHGDPLLPADWTQGWV